MDSIWAAAYATAGDATTGRPDRHAGAHAGNDLPSDARREPDGDADSFANADAHTCPHGEADWHAHRDAEADRHANDDAEGHVDPDSRTNGVVHGDSITDAQPDTAPLGRTDPVPAQRSYPAAGRHGVS